VFTTIFGRRARGDKDGCSLLVVWLVFVKDFLYRQQLTTNNEQLTNF